MPPVKGSSAEGLQQQHMRREADCVATRIAETQAKVQAATAGITQFEDTLTRSSAQGDALSGILSNRGFNGALQQAKTAAQNLDTKLAACKSDLVAIPDSQFGASFPNATSTAIANCTALDAALASWQTALTNLEGNYTAAAAQLQPDQRAKASLQWAPLDGPGGLFANMTATATSTKDDLNSYITLAQGTCPAAPTSAPSSNSSAAYGAKEQGIVAGSLLGAGVLATFTSNHLRKVRGFFSEATSLISSGLKHVQHPQDAEARKEASTRLFERDAVTLRAALAAPAAPLAVLSPEVTRAASLTDATRQAALDVANLAHAGTPDPRTHISKADEKVMQRNLGRLAGELDTTLANTPGHPTIGNEFQVLVGAQAIKDMPKDREATALKCGAFDDHLTHDSALFGERWLSTRINRGWFGETTPGMERLRAVRAAVAAAEATETVALINWHRDALIALEANDDDIAPQCAAFAARVDARHLNPELVYDLLTACNVEQARAAVVKAMHGGLDNEFNTYVGDDATPKHVQTKRNAPEQAFADALLPEFQRAHPDQPAWFGTLTDDGMAETFVALRDANIVGKGNVPIFAVDPVVYPAADATPVQVRRLEGIEWKERNAFFGGRTPIDRLQEDLANPRVNAQLDARIVGLQRRWDAAFDDAVVPGIADPNLQVLVDAKRLLGLDDDETVANLKLAVPNLAGRLRDAVDAARNEAQRLVAEAVTYPSTATLGAANHAIAAVDAAVRAAERYVLPTAADFA